MNNQQGDGLEKCINAFERLKVGNGLIKVIEKSEISCSTVSVEAGFDKGYLKKTRLWQSRLVGEINDYKREHALSSTSAATELQRTQKKVKKATDDKDKAESLLYTLMQDNLKLVARIRELEKLVEKYESGKVINMKNSPI
ncbi:MAG: hypothetical protein JKX78_07750 [Alteromonadaceae bacterium]|nr:hypothetical protein [Alteromonadaceae bacterium]